MINYFGQTFNYENNSWINMGHRKQKAWAQTEKKGNRKDKRERDEFGVGYVKRRNNNGSQRRKKKEQKIRIGPSLLKKKNSYPVQYLTCNE